MDRHNYNGLEIAKYLDQHSKINKVMYPGLATDPNYTIAKKQMKGFGGILSIDIKTDFEGIKRFLDNLSLFTLS